MKIYIVLLLLAMPASQAQAEQIYKCSDGKGGTSYQQIPCANLADTKQVYRYIRPAERPRNYNHNQDYSQYQGQASPTQYQSTPEYQQRGSQGSIISNPSGPSMQDKLAQIARDPRFKGSPSARHAAMSAAMQEAGMQPLAPYQPAYPTSRTSNPSDGVGLPANVIDQRTGMPINGAIKVAPNRIWDPSTGQYLEAHP